MLNRQGIYIIPLPPKPTTIDPNHVCRHWRATNLEDWDENPLSTPEYQCVTCGKRWTP